MSVQISPSSSSDSSPRLPARPAVTPVHDAAGLQPIKLVTGNIVPLLPGKSGTARPEDVTAAVSELNDYARNINRQLEFILDKEINQVIVRVYNADNEELIRQIPSEEALTLARRLVREEGLFLDTRA